MEVRRLASATAPGATVKARAKAACWSSGEGGGVDGGEVVDVAGDEGVGVVDGVGCVVLVGSEEDFGGEVALVGVEILHLGAGEVLGGKGGDVAGLEVGGLGEIGFGDAAAARGWRRCDVIDVAGADGRGEIDGVGEEIFVRRGKVGAEVSTAR